MFGTNHVAAQDKGVSFSGGSDLVSSYYWRGVKESGPALQPTLTMTAGNFSVTAWGSIDFSDSGGPAGARDAFGGRPLLDRT